MSDIDKALENAASKRDKFILLVGKAVQDNLGSAGGGSLLQDIANDLEPQLLQGCSLEDLSSQNGVYGAGKRAISIYVQSGTCDIGGVTVTAPFSITYGEGGTQNTLAGINIDATVDGTNVVLGSTVG